MAVRDVWTAMPTSVATREHEHSVKTPQKIRYPFWFGGSASCCAAVVTHPLDLVKVRLQTRGANGPQGMVGMFAHVFKSDGVAGLYRGLSASLLRQCTYSTTRFGVYEYIKARVPNAPDSNAPSFAALMGMAATSGFLGGVAGNPADILNVRMQNDSSLPPESRRNYRSAADGLVRMAREEGPRSLFRGVWPNSMRAVLMTSSQLVSYDSIKDAFLRLPLFEDNLATHFLASIAAGFIATTICSPVDVIKTRVMSAEQREGVLAVVARISKAEGIRWMFRGWVPSFIRLGPHTVATFMFLEQHKKIYRHLKGLED